MAEDDDQTRELMEKLLAELYGKAAGEDALKGGKNRGSYLIAGDEQFLGKITTNPYDTDSILNRYGPYGSVYSSTSIWNKYSQYGGPYGRFSPENPYTTSPPTLVINDRVIGKVSTNSYVPNRIPVEAFVHSLQTDLNGLLQGRIARTDVQVQANAGETFIQAADGTFLGNLNPNKMDTNSLFNRYGEYGNKFSNLSIFNKFSSYGGAFSIYSPYNPSTKSPPRIVSGGQAIAYLTVNKSLKPRIDPADVLSWAQENVRRRLA